MCAHLSMSLGLLSPFCGSGRIPGTVQYYHKCENASIGNPIDIDIWTKYDLIIPGLMHCIQPRNTIMRRAKQKCYVYVLFAFQCSETLAAVHSSSRMMKVKGWWEGLTAAGFIRTRLSTTRSPTCSFWFKVLAQQLNTRWMSNNVHVHRLTVG